MIIPVLRFVTMTIPAAGIIHKNTSSMPFHFFIMLPAAPQMDARKIISTNLANSDG